LWYVINFGDCKEAYLGVKQLRSANKKKINPDEVTVGVNLEAVWGGKYYVGTVERVSIVEPKLTKKEREVRTQVEREKESKVQTLIPFFERRQRRQRRQRTFLFPFVFDLSAFF